MCRIDERRGGDFASGNAHGSLPYRLKRLTDLLSLGIPFLLPASPLLGLSVATLLETGRPVLCKPRRLGRGGRPLTLYKLRNMTSDAEQELDIAAMKTVAAGIVKIAHDPRVASVGRWLRHFSLGELPQLCNGVRGDMSLVGPRPHDAAEFVADLSEHMESRR